MTWAKQEGYRHVKLSALCHVVSFYERFFKFKIRRTATGKITGTRFPFPSPPPPNKIWCPNYTDGSPEIQDYVNDLKQRTSTYQVGDCNNGITMYAKL